MIRYFFQNIDKKLKLLSKMSLLGLLFILGSGYTTTRNIIGIMKASEIPMAHITTELIPAIIHIIIEVFFTVVISYLLYAVGLLIEFHKKDVK